MTLNHRIRNSIATALLITSIPGCRSTTAVEPQSSVKSEPTDAPTDAPTNTNATTAAADKYFWVPEDLRKLLVDSVPITTPPGMNYQEDYGLEQTPPEMSEEEWKKKLTVIRKLARKPMEYEREVVIPRINGGKPGPKRNLFAAKTVLEAMRRLRRFFGVQPLRLDARSQNYAEIPGGTGISRSEWKALYSEGYDEGYNANVNITQPIQHFRASWLASLKDSEGGNYGVMPRVWNDLQSHFYPLLPHRTHGCWTGLFWTLTLTRDSSCKAPFFQADGRDKHADQGISMRQHFLNICTGVDGFQLTQDQVNACGDNPLNRFLAVAVGAIPAQLHAYNHLWVDPSSGQFIDPPPDLVEETGAELLRPEKPGELVNPSRVHELKAVKWQARQRAKGMVNVFDYVMLAQTWAFDWEQTQAVLTAFYGEVKTWPSVILDRRSGAELGRVPGPFYGSSGKEAHPFDPANLNECKFYRPTRSNDPADGTHCRSDKSWTVPMVSGGR